MTIDRNDAPEGYEARAIVDGCSGCAFRFQACWRVKEPCSSATRSDEHNVIFVKRKPHLVATGGRRPKAPEWATRYRLHFRRAPAEDVNPEHALPRSLFLFWRHYGTDADILFVEWLP